jgi:hypothetical protein
VRRGAYKVNLREKDRLEHLGKYGRIILKGSSRNRMGCGMDWIDLAQDRDSYGAVVKVVMKLWVPQNSSNFLTSCYLLKKNSSPWS